VPQRTIALKAVVGLLPLTSLRSIVGMDLRRSYCFASEGAPMKKLLFVIGMLATLLGLLWIGQGTGYIAWPQSSFMISQIQWAYYGAALAVGGLILIWWGRH
jgi:uncharacterized membrane protein